MLNRQTGDLPPGYLVRDPLKQGWKECVLRLILHRLKQHPYDGGDALYKGPILMKRLLQARVCNMRVPTRHLIQGDHRVPSPLNLIVQAPSLRCLRPDKYSELSAPCHNM